MPESSAVDLVDLIIKRAPELRRAGVLTIEIGELKAQLAPHQDEVPVEKEKRDAPTDPLLNPHTYGLPEGSKIPGLSHLEVIDDESSKR